MQGLLDRKSLVGNAFRAWHAETATGTVNVMSEAPANLRDLGGLPLDNGGRTQFGVLLRSDALYAGDAVPELMRHWPPSRVIDLRSAPEAAASPATWRKTTRVISHELFDGAALGAIDTTAPLSGLYREIMHGRHGQIVSAIGHFDLGGTTMVHCSAGKDRTGVVIAVALALAGVRREAIVEDYMHTRANIGGVLRRMRVHDVSPSIDPAASQLDSPAEAVSVVLDILEAAPGGPWGWFEAGGGDALTFSSWLSTFRDAG